MLEPCVCPHCGRPTSAPPRLYDASADALLTPDGAPSFVAFKSYRRGPLLVALQTRGGGLMTYSQAARVLYPEAGYCDYVDAHTRECIGWHARQLDKELQAAGWPAGTVTIRRGKGVWLSV